LFYLIEKDLYYSLNTNCFFYFIESIIILKPLTGGGGANRQHVTTKNTAKLDRETEELKHDQVPLELGKLIQQGRQNKGLSQKDLATVKYLYAQKLLIIRKIKYKYLL